MRINKMIISDLCPLCGDGNSLFFYKDKNRSYYRCANCMLLFVPPAFYPNQKEEKAEYDLHNNNPDDPGYRKFLSRLATPLLGKLQPSGSGLDFGCGPGPALSVMMEENGHSVDIYDPFYFPDSSVFSKKYDFITATEVVEHFQNPGREFELLFQMLKPGGYLGLMTKMVKDKDAFKTWHYIQDLTHICFYSRETFEFLARKYSAELEFSGNDVIIFQRSDTSGYFV